MHNALILHYQETARSNGGSAAENVTAQLSLIKKLNMPVVSLRELVANNHNRRRWHRHVLLISCTDTFLTQNPSVFPELKAAGFPVTVFIAAGQNPAPEQINFWQEMAAAGFSFGLHGASEFSGDQKPEADLQAALAVQKAMIEGETGKPIQALLPVAGEFPKRVITAARALGFEAIWSAKVGYNRFNADLFQLKTWFVPPQTSLKAFERMLCRDKKELVAQEMKARALKNGRVLKPKSLFGKLKGLFRRVRV
jgi:peptidoglycan/xylan/chitin deacetylase (PgdA/CDA1 family)